MRAPLSLRVVRTLMRAVPPLPRALGLANHIVRPWFAHRCSEPVDVWVEGARMTLDPRQHVDALLLFGGHLLDRTERRFLARRLAPGEVFVDAGAYLGLYALTLAPVVGRGGRVLCIEAHDATAARLRTHLDDNGLSWVDLATVALMSHSGTASLVLDDGANAGSRRVQPGADLPARTLPQVLRDAGIVRAHAVKTDLEGQDAGVVDNALSTLPRASWPHTWVCESPREDDAVSPILRSAGYRVERLSRLNVAASLD